MLIGFKPDYIEVGENTEKKGVTDVIVGIYNRALSKNNNYNALLSLELV
jgi:stage II sporulation protein GA (sporulation sigma-E factor processing peptidase)